MEHPTEFDLNATIGRWRNQLAQSPALRAEDVAELESHVRDATATLANRGLSEEEAWLIATRRVGGGAALEAEFAKVNRPAIWLDRLLWMLIGVQCWGVLVGLSRAAADAVVSGGLVGSGIRIGQHQGFGSNLLLPGTLFFVVQLAALVFSIVALVWCVRLQGKVPAAWLRRMLSRPVALGAAAAGIVLLQVASQIAMWLENTLWLKWLGAPQYGVLVASKSSALGLVYLVQIVAIAALTVWLVRRRVRETC
jgi:hypothetical protein